MPAEDYDEGEIIELEQDTKATSPPVSKKDPRVDRDSRDYAYSHSHSHSSRGRRSASPNRKRHHRDDHDRDYERSRYRRDEGPQRRAPVSYADIDDGLDGHSRNRSDDYNGSGGSKRQRIRSRSPKRSSYREKDRRPHNESDREYDRRREKPLPKRDSSPPMNRTSSNDHDRFILPESPPRLPDIKDFTPEDPVNEAAIIEERRRKREAIRAKYRGQETPLLIQALHIKNESSDVVASRSSANESNEAGKTKPVSIESPAQIASSSQTAYNSVQVSPVATPVADDSDLMNQTNHAKGADSPSAADYDPTVDMREDTLREEQRKHHPKEDLSERPEPSAEASQSNQHNTGNGDFDMFADDDDDDMFAAPKLNSDKAVPGVLKIAEGSKALDLSMLDEGDDPEGYYRVILGELLDGRYHVQANLGKGMFSAVVKAKDSETGKIVAIKLIRNNETMRKAGQKEIDILDKLMAADPEDKRHVIRLVRQFDHKSHLCMVFEMMSINLREVLKKFGRDVGLNLKAVRTYSHQIFLALSLMRRCNIIHADLKPDNILVNDGRNILKVCDLGSASDASENEITPYLVSRFYRAPEIILGLPYDFAIDMWSIGCTLYELYTGKILFTGRTNNQMLKAIMECRGRFSPKMLRRSQFAPLHFDEHLSFRSIENDKITGKEVVKMLNFVKPSRDLRSRLNIGTKGMTQDEAQELALFTDLLERCLNLNPEKRITPNEALQHPFIHRN